MVQVQGSYTMRPPDPNRLDGSRSADDSVGARRIAQDPDSAAGLGRGR
jgi:hypothetical protein